MGQRREFARSTYLHLMASKQHLYFHPAHGLAQVKQGFCWPAFFFGSLWALARRLYLLAVVLLAFEVAVWFCGGYALSQGPGWAALPGLLAPLVYAVVRGRYGNRWVASALLARGYERWGDPD
jgi:hypothetical protein